MQSWLHSTEIQGTQDATQNVCMRAHTHTKRSDNAGLNKAVGLGFVNYKGLPLTCQEAPRKHKWRYSRCTTLNSEKPRHHE